MTNLFGNSESIHQKANTILIRVTLIKWSLVFVVCAILFCWPNTGKEGALAQAISKKAPSTPSYRKFTTTPLKFTTTPLADEDDATDEDGNPFDKKVNNKQDTNPDANPIDDANSEIGNEQYAVDYEEQSTTSSDQTETTNASIMPDICGSPGIIDAYKMYLVQHYQWV